MSELFDSENKILLLILLAVIILNSGFLVYQHQLHAMELDSYISECRTSSDYDLCLLRFAQSTKEYDLCLSIGDPYEHDRCLYNVAYLTSSREPCEHLLDRRFWFEGCGYFKAGD